MLEVRLSRLRGVLGVSGVLAVVLLGPGCATQPQPTAFGWSHPLGGEYLFAFDHDACQQAAAGDLAAPAFFDCMLSRDYVLVDPKTGALLDVEQGEVVRSSAADRLPEAASLGTRL